MTFSHLFSPGKIGGVVLKNRIIMPIFPTKYARQSRVNRQMTEFYRARAKGGAALIILDCPCLEFPSAYKGGHQLRFDKAEYAEGIKALLDVIHHEGAKAFMHLNYLKEMEWYKKHSDEPCDEPPGLKQKKGKWVVPIGNTMTLEQADVILSVMIRGAVKAEQLGYDGVEIQASYGGLIAQLLSPLLNNRTDRLGGSFENRISFLIGLIQGIRQKVAPGFPVMVKLVCDEFVEKGIGIEEGIKIAREVEKAGADAIVANGGNKSTKHFTIPGHDSPPGPLVDLADRVKKNVTIPVVAIGKIGDPGLANTVIEEGKADFTGMARALVADPDLPSRAKQGEPDKIRRCVYCLEDCADKGVPGIGRCCAVNPFTGLEHVMQKTPVETSLNVLVVGGGPAGIQAALLADSRGHDVTLWEKQERIGGQARLMHLPPQKKEMEQVLYYFKRCLQDSSVTIKTNKEADIDKIMDFSPDVIVMATGSRPVLPKISGVSPDKMVLARDLYEGAPVSGKNILIIGGGDVGCETADLLAAPGREITVVELLPNLLSNMKKLPKGRLISRLSEKGVNVLTETRMVSMDNKEVTLRGKDNQEFSIPADLIIFALAGKPENRLANEVKDRFNEVFLVGDAAGVGNLGSSLRSAAAVALKI